MSDPKTPRASYDVFLSHSFKDSAYAREIAKGLQGNSLRVWLDDEQLQPGDSLTQSIEEGLRDSTIALFVLSGNSSHWQRQELASAARLSRNAKTNILPVFLHDAIPEELPYGLGDIKGIRYDGQESLPTLVGAVRTLLARAAAQGKIVQGAPSDDPSLRKLAERYFRAAGRTPIDEPNEGLRIPDPVWIATETPALPDQPRSLAELLDRGELGYLVHEAELPVETEEAIEALRTRGNPIVTLSANVMRAALSDGTARRVFDELTRAGRGGDNLFAARRPVFDPQLFFGRERLLTHLGTGLARGEFVLLTGTRKSGKTSLLNILRQHLSDHPVAWLDLQLYDRTSDRWPQRLFCDVIEAYDRWGQSAFEGWPSTSARPKDEAEFVQQLRDLRKVQLSFKNDRPLLFILDELERVLPGPGERKVAERFIKVAGVLRALAQRGDSFVSLVAADLRPVANRRNDLEGAGTNPFYQLFHELPLPRWDFDGVKAMVYGIARRMGISEIDDQFVARVLRESGGHAFLARWMCASAYESRRFPERLDWHDLVSGIEALEDRDELGSFYQSNFWEPLSAQERHILSTVSAPAPVWDREALSALVYQGLLEGRQIPMGHFARWVKQRPEEKEEEEGTGATRNLAG